MKYFPDKMTLEWLRAGYANNKLTPYEVAEEIVKRTARYEDYNIWITKPSYDAMKKYIDNIINEDKKKYPLWGIPFAIKDNIDLAGVTTTAACEEYGYVPDESATVVKKLIAAGAIPVGKTNLDQFATGLVGTRSPYGEVHNAMKPELISGGSSSGSAVAVALGMVAFSLGTDTAGSGRVPAALNGLVGFKPPLGSWSTKGVVPACASLDCVTVFANNLHDAKAVNQLAKGYDDKCIWSRTYTESVAKMPKKICLAKSDVVFYGDYADIYKNKWEKAVERIRSLGVEVEYIDYSMFKKAASILYDGPWVAERWKDLGEFVESHPGQTFPVTEKILRSGDNPSHTAASVFGAMHELQEYRFQAAKLLEDAVLIMPTAGGTFTREQVRNNPIETNSQMGLYTNHCNLLDMCAVNVPVIDDTCPMPFGITIFALADSEEMLLKTAEHFLGGESIELAVCGLHKHTGKLEWQLTQLGADYLRSTKTAPEYRLYELDTVPVKPGMVKADDGGAIEVDIYRIPVNSLGQFMKYVAGPLSIGTVKLEDGKLVKGFLCEEYAVKNAKDITAIGRFDLKK